MTRSRSDESFRTDHWCGYAFSELCDITRGASPRPIHEWISSNGVPWIKISDASATESRTISDTRERIRREGRTKSVSVVPGDLILSNSATPGIPKFVGIDACIHDGWLLLRNLRNIDRLFCYYLLISERSRIVRQGTGSVFTNLKTEILKNHRVRIPPLSEQRAIAHILGTLDDKIELNRRMNETLEAIVRAIFKDWFVDFGPTLAKIEGRGPYLAPELWNLFAEALDDQSKPIGWKREAIGRHVVVEKGLSYKGAGLTDAGRGIPLHNLNSILEGGGYKNDGLKFYMGDYKQRHLIQPGDLIVANTEQGFDHLLIGYSSLVPAWIGEKGLFSHHLFKVEPRQRSPLSRTWLHFALSASSFGEAIRRYSNVTTVNMLPRDALEKPDIIVPPVGLIQAFGKIVAPKLRRLEDTFAESQDLARIRDLLLPKLISGQIQVGDRARAIRAAQ